MTATPSVDLLWSIFDLAEDGRLIRRPHPSCPKHANSRWAGKRAGSVVSGYRRARVLGRKYSEHRIIFKMIHGFDPVEVDHINGDTLDNRPENLRAADRYGNVHNVRVRKDSASGIKGVWFYKKTGKWASEIKAFGIRTFLGYYATKEEAATVYRTAALKLHGEFAARRDEPIRVLEEWQVVRRSMKEAA